MDLSHSLYLGFMSMMTVASAQEVRLTPTEELRATVSEWVETMQKVQAEENDWSRDKEVLQNYREGLEKEIAHLKEQITHATTRKEGADHESLDKVAERDRYAATKDESAGVVRRLEEALSANLRVFPSPLLKEPRVAQGVEDLERALILPVDQQGDNVSKRLLNLINLTTEAEKFQQTVHIRPELMSDSNGREFNMKVIYFGLAVAYAVNEDHSFALVGKPGSRGWVFEKHNELAPEIARLIAITHGDLDAEFVNLPFELP